MLPGRTHTEGRGTVLTTIPTIATTILGLLVGRMLMSSLAQESKLRILMIVGVSAVALGIGMNPVVPAIMRLWTSSYALTSAGWACLLFLVFHWIIDVRGL